MSERVLFTLIGVIVGGIAGSLLTSHFFGKDYKKRIAELEAENKQLRAKKASKKARDISDKEIEVREKETEVDSSLLMQLTQAREEKRHSQELAKSHGYSVEEDDFDSDEDVDFDDPFDDDEEIVKKPEEKREPSFKIISQDTYEEDFEYRDSESLTYYQEDHVLADAFDDRVGHPETVIGEEALLKADNTDSEYVYVLDELEDKMYEIEINHEESFYRDIVRGGV